ncbi:sterol carrier family protein [Branchiibius cervicis]|uniref:Sterol carrier family protein n=1 Tax=Branchiibius cervicis TaxID=908252 RepID=A0ABW2AX05_9MICO
MATAVRYSLEELGLVAPGRSVEVRVPPYGAVQVIAGQVHRRGTPPNVVEMSADVWLALVVGDLAWDDALSSGTVSASGGRSDLTPYLPLMRSSR